MAKYMPICQLAEEDGTFYATAHLPDGSCYTAVAASLPELHERLHESMLAEGWTGWALVPAGLQWTTATNG